MTEVEAQHLAERVLVHSTRRVRAAFMTCADRHAGPPGSPLFTAEQWEQLRRELTVAVTEVLEDFTGTDAKEWL